MDERDDKTIQLEDTKEPGRPIEEGFSGGAVWVDSIEKVVGMVTSADGRKGTKVSFMISGHTILSEWEELKLPEDKKETINIPIIVVSMTESESNYIKKAILSGDKTDPIQNIIKWASGGDMKEYFSRYSKFRDHWRPYFHSDLTIHSIIKNLTHKINYGRPEVPNQKYINPFFLSEDLFCKDSDKRYVTSLKIKQSGGVVISDAISLFHPGIKKIFSDSGIDSHDNISILSINPINKSTFKINQDIEEKNKSCMFQAFKRFSKTFDEFCEFGMNDMNSINRWLYKSLEKAADPSDDYKPNFDRCFLFHQSSKTKTQGMGSLVAKGGPSA